MEKREFMEQAWVHISKRLPKDEEHTQVLTYNSQTGYMYVWPSSQAREYAQLCLDNDTEILSWDRHITHWMPLYAPENCPTYAEYLAKQAKSKRRK